MAPIGALLRRKLRIHSVYGANTEVGKTIFSTILCNSAARLWKNERVSYVKPVSTGSLDEADDGHIEKYAPGVNKETLFQYDIPMSPHAAAFASGRRIPNDHELLGKIHEYAVQKVAHPGWLFLETAGGVHSPGPSGTTQADLYAPLRTPVILVGDSKLGGISQTISAFESLRIRGYDVENVLLFREKVYENHRHLTEYFAEKYGIPVETVKQPPERKEDSRSETESMRAYYDEVSQDASMQGVLKRLASRHQERINRLEEMPSQAHKHIWYPFTQQKHLTEDRITAIDSAYGDYFQTLSRKKADDGAADSNVLQPSFDGSASWWTQGLGHASPQLTMAAAYAAGRYGHVMFAEAIHEPALALSEALLSGLDNPRLNRVFFSDNGSTGCEVAVKMALRATRLRYNDSDQTKLGVLGLKGSYHGDTIGAMDCAEPCTFNEKVEWYEGRGYWFDYPTVICRQGKWVVEVPESLKGHLGHGKAFASLDGVFDVEARERGGEEKKYEGFIVKTLEGLRDQGARFGALMLEPVILGAGGMIFVDPLFQRTLVNVVRRYPHLLTDFPPLIPSCTPTTWTGLPVIFDEVFTGLYRLGRYTSSSFLGVHPDISVHAKLLTGGLVPLCTTLASESIFDAFSSDDKSDALLHGHSYTAHPVGCQVALESLRELDRLNTSGKWDTFKSDWATTPSSPPSTNGSTSANANANAVWSVWPLDFITAISNQITRVAGVWSLGSVLAITLRSDDGSGYKSTAALTLQARLREGVQDAEKKWNVHARVLGNVFYVMAGQKTTPDGIAEIEKLLRDALFS